MAHQFFPTHGTPGGFGNRAKVAELVDALDLGSSGATRGSSSLPFRTIGTQGASLPLEHDHQQV
jgi:hypothetical protein